MQKGHLLASLWPGGLRHSHRKPPGCPLPPPSCKSAGPGSLASLPLLQGLFLQTSSCSANPFSFPARPCSLLQASPVWLPKLSL